MKVIAEHLLGSIDEVIGRAEVVSRIAQALQRRRGLFGRHSGGLGRLAPVKVNPLVRPRHAGLPCCRQDATLLVGEDARHAIFYHEVAKGCQPPGRNATEATIVMRSVAL